MTKGEMECRIANLERNFLILASKPYTQKIEVTQSSVSRVENKEDEAVDDLYDGLAESLMLIVNLMKDDEEEEE